MNLNEAIVLAFEYLEVTYKPKWTTGLGSKNNLIKAFSQSAISKHEYLGYKGADGIRHSFNRAIPNHNKPKGIWWEHWLLSNINLFLCTKCSSIQTLSEKAHTKYLCKTCDTTKTLARKELNQELIYNILDKSSCMDCGYTNPIALEFDHRDPTTKLFNIADGYLRSKEELILEVSKCDIVCANCHRLRTAKYYNFYSYKRVMQ